MKYWTRRTFLGLCAGLLLAPWASAAVTIANPEAAAYALLGTIRNLKFTASASTESEVQHGRESMGRQVKSAITGAKELPVTITLTLPIWAKMPKLRVPIEAMLILDSEKETLALEPLADSLEQAIEEAHSLLAVQIGTLCESLDVQCPVLNGMSV